MEPSQQEPAGGRGRGRFVPAAVIVFGLLTALALGWQRYLTLAWLGESRDALRVMVDANLGLALVVFLLFHVTATAFAFPAAAMLTVFAGFLFGWKLGMTVIMAGSIAGATILFLSARAASGGYLRRKVAAIAPRFEAGFERDSFFYLLVLRLAPFIPFFMVTILPALFNVRLKTFLAATALGIVPGAFPYSRLGEGADSVLVAARAAGREATLSDLVTTEIRVAFAALALVTLIATVVRRVWLRDAP
ncbi:MAG: TVP38/TMEM64 family protein [Rhizobiaceae bacterium]|nr:TVP38/TMEM64 family protein [Rhizobiaceae bacterium]